MLEQLAAECLCFVVELLHAVTPDIERRVQAGMDDYRRRFAQPSVLRVVTRVRANFERRHSRSPIMLLAKYALLVGGVLLLLTWLVSIVAIVAGIRRRLARAHGAGRPGSTSLPIGAVAGVPLAALALTVNLVVFIGALCWHRLRGKPLPPPPKLG